MHTIRIAVPVFFLFLATTALSEESARHSPVGRYTLTVQGFEGEDVFEKKDKVSHMSGVPESYEVDVWEMKLYRRRRVPRDQAGIVCSLSPEHTTEGKRALRAEFRKGAEALRVSLRNNINGPEAGQPPRTVGCFDALKGDIYNPEGKAIELELRVLGGFALTDDSMAFGLLKKLELKPGWNTFTIANYEVSESLVDPHDAACVEFHVPDAKKRALFFDNFRLERETIPENMKKHARCFDFGVSYFTWPGFEHGSVAYDEARGYGFTAGKKLSHGGDLHVLNDMLTRDGFKAPATFKVKLPNGKYRARLLTGNYWIDHDGSLNVEIKAEGKRAWYKPIMKPEEKRQFRHANALTDHWKPDFDSWKAYWEDTHFKEVTFDVEVADGALDLEFKLPPLPEGMRPGGSSTWNYLIVYPADKDALLRPDLVWLEEKRRFIYNRVFHAHIGRQFALYNREEIICPEEFLWPDLADQRRVAAFLRAPVSALP